MAYGDSELLKERGSVRLLKIGCKNDKESYCVIGSGRTKHYDDYDDALEEYNLRWMRNEYGD